MLRSVSSSGSVSPLGNAPESLGEPGPWQLLPVSDRDQHRVLGQAQGLPGRHSKWSQPPPKWVMGGHRKSLIFRICIFISGPLEMKPHNQKQRPIQYENSSRNTLWNYYIQRGSKNPPKLWPTNPQNHSICLNKALEMGVKSPLALFFVLWPPVLLFCPLPFLIALMLC